jgi:hypothetical protein
MNGQERKFLVLMFLAACALLALSFFAQTASNAQDGQEEDKPRVESPAPYEGEGDLEEEELESLKRAWKKGEEEKKEENPSGASSEEQDPLETIARKMKIAERRLSEEDPGDETRKKQLEAIDLLNELIKKAQEAPQQRPQAKPRPSPLPQPAPGREKPIDPYKSPPAQPNSRRLRSPMEKSGVKIEPKGGALEERWDVLRACDREDAITASKEEFPQKYEKLLGIYYRGLLKR